MSILDSIIGAALGGARGTGAASGGTAGGAGGLMDILGQVTGGGQAGQPSLIDILGQLGGLDGVVGQLQQHAPDAVGSWISQGANSQLGPDRIRAIIGDGPIAQVAQRFGISPEQISQIIATQLPALIDAMTPDGNAPTGAGAGGGGGFGDILGQVLRQAR